MTVQLSKGGNVSVAAATGGATSVTVSLPWHARPATAAPGWCRLSGRTPIADDELFALMLQKYPGWLPQPRAKGLLPR